MEGGLLHLRRSRPCLPGSLARRTGSLLMRSILTRILASARQKQRGTGQPGEPHVSPSCGRNTALSPMSAKLFVKKAWMHGFMCPAAGAVRTWSVNGAQLSGKAFQGACCAESGLEARKSRQPLPHPQASSSSRVHASVFYLAALWQTMCIRASRDWFETSRTFCNAWQQMLS